MKSNEELRGEVMEEIKWDPELSPVATQIGVAAKDGVITLTGTVDSIRKKISAELATQRVHGVMVVASDIEVSISGSGVKTDTQIAEAVKDALRWHSAVREDQIEVRVENGWVYLTGETGGFFEKMAAEHAVGNLLGVRGVTNNIAVKAKPVDTKVIKEKIAAAFHRSATIDSSSIKIENTGNHIRLRGTVRSFAEKDEAEKIVRSAPGVLSVDNKITIEPIFV
jgi:osmotically-inducible protein OsmY